MIRFDRVNYRYRDTNTGRFVRRADVLGLVDGEVSRLETRLKGHARLLMSGKIPINEFQERMALSLKESHIRMAALGAGGTQSLTKSDYGRIGAQLKEQYKYLHGFGFALQSQELSTKQILARTAQYAQSTKIAFHSSEFKGRNRVGFYAKRLLDPQSNHCSECIAYQQPTWVQISQIIPPGINCTCGGRCRCRVVFRKI